MPTLFLFLFKVNIALLLFCAGYYLVLRHLTFYTLNRVYLVTAIVFATIYPKIDLTGFAQKHEELARPVQNVALVWQAPAQKLATYDNYWQWAEYAFWAGAALLGIRFAVQLFSLLKLYRNSKPASIYDYEVRVMDSNAAPFSFWQSIYVNPANHTAADLKAILLHEQVHVKGWHTIDILLAELSSIFYWFNPGVWLMKKAVRENIEFITDRKILNKGFDTKAYQYSLVNVSFNNSTPGIVNHFNISTIKKRIIMMNAKRSSKLNLTRYVFVIPAVVALLLVFTLSKADVAKPIKLSISKVVQPVTFAIKNAAVTAINGTKTAITETKAAALIMVKDTVLKRNYTFTVHTNPGGAKTKTDTATFSLTVNKPDTGKKAKLMISTSENGSVDSMNLVLNGKKITPADFKNIDPNKILSINMVSPGAIDGLVGPDNNFNFDNNRHVLFITTNDSEDGKKLAERLGKRQQLTNIHITGATRSLASANSGETTVISSLPNLPATIRLEKNAKGEAVKTLRVNGKTLKLGEPAPLNQIIVDARPAKLRLNEVVVNKVYTTDSAVSVTGFGTNKLTTAIAKSYKGAPANAVVISSGYQTGSEPANQLIYSLNGATSISAPLNLSGKLYIIDGKEASEKAMKKLSAYDIDRINVSKANNMVDKYGDKAKNGVVYIYTKKNKK